MDRPKLNWVAAVAAGVGLFNSALLLADGQGQPPQRRAVMQLAQVRPGIGRAPRPADRDDDLSLDGVFLPPDRSAKRRLEMADQMIADGRFGEAVRLLGSLLENSEDYFFKPNADQPLYRSLKAEAGRLIASLPDEGRESYELQFGAKARLMLKRAAAEGSASQLAEASRQFFFTQAGQEATFLLGRHYLDHNRPLMAALCFERVRELGLAGDRLEPALTLSLATSWLRAGKPEKAKDSLVRLKESRFRGDVLIGGKQVKLFGNESQALAWLQDVVGPQKVRAIEAGQWAMFRGDETRNAPSAGGQPLLSLRWRQRTADDRSVEKFVTKVRQDYLSQDIVALPSFHPLAVGDTVIMRTAFALQAVDFNNGKLIWKYTATDDSFDQFLKAGSSQHPGQSVQLFSGLDQRLWEDATYGTLSSDGEQVYFVDDLGLGTVASPLTTILPNGRRVTAQTRNMNRLAARELRTQGKLKWEVGGATGDDEPKLAGAFFLGPPLPLLGHLYALAELKGQEIRLVVLSAKTGALEWSQQLAVVEGTITTDATRRNAGVTPSFADGVLVCPTSAGAVVAIDSATHSLLWGYQYPRVQQTMDRFNAVRLSIYPGTERHANEHWVDGSVTISDGHVLLTPVESDQIYCLRLSDGKEVWKQNRGSNLYVACVHRGNVVLVGRNSISAIHLADGQPVWKSAELPSGALPSGRGFYSGDHYYLPLTTAEVAKFNLQTGQLQQTAKSRSGTIPGNLVCFRGSIISQGADHLDVYYQLDALKDQIAKTLQERPNDARALASLAEIKLDQGSLAEAIELFRKSFQARKEDTTREQLVSCLLEGLGSDFAAHRAELDELNRLIDREPDRLTYLRLLALGLQSAGETLPAFQAYLKLADQDSHPGLDNIEQGLSTRRDRWIRSQLGQLVATANDDERRQLDAEIEQRLQAAIDTNKADALRSFLAIFGSHASANQAREKLLALLTADDMLEAESHLRKIELAGNQAQIARAVARLAPVMAAAGRIDVAASYYRKLQDRFADVTIDGKTGKEIVAALPADAAVRKKLVATHTAWPRGKVAARDEKSLRPAGPPRVPRVADLEIVGPPGDVFKDTTISLDSQQRILLGLDGFGDRRFRVQISEPGGNRFARFNGYNAPPLSYVSVNGGLLMLSTSNQLLAIDALRGPDSTSPILWSQDLSDQIGGFPTSQNIFSRPMQLAWGGTRYLPEDAMNRRYGTIGPINDDGVYFQRLRDLHCVDPLTGAAIWTRRNVGLGNDLFGDDELLFVSPTGDADSLVLRASTGELVGTRRIASADKRMLTLGRLVLSWEPAGGQHSLTMRDPWQDKTVWDYSFAAGSKAAIVSQEVIGILQPDGQFSLITLADGKLLAKEQLEPEKGLIGLYLLASPDEYLLVTNASAKPEQNMTVQSIPSAINSPIINGRVYGFSRTTGAKLWPAPVVVSQYGMLLTQPGQLPVLTFVRMVHRPRPPGGNDPKVGVMCIDKHTGRVVYNNDQLAAPTVGNLEINGDPEAHTVTIAITPSVVTLSYTDEPESAKDPKTSEAKPN